MLHDFINGLKCAVSGFRLIREEGIKRFALIPLIINIIIFTAAIWLAVDQISILSSWMMNWLPDWLAWLTYLFWVLFGFVGLIIVFYTFTLVANFIGAPFNGLYSEKLEKKRTGNTPPSSGRKSTTATIKSAFTSELNKLGYLLVWVVPLLLLSFVPILNTIMPLVWFVFGAWMLSLEYMDYPMGNHEITFPEQRQLLRERRGLALGFGCMILIMTSIPILNFFAMPVAVAGATELWIKHFLNQNSS